MTHITFYGYGCEERARSFGPGTIIDTGTPGCPSVRWSGRRRLDCVPTCTTVHVWGT